MYHGKFHLDRYIMSPPTPCGAKNTSILTKCWIRFWIFPCQVSSRSVHLVVHGKPQILPYFIQLQHSVVAPTSGVQTKLNASAQLQTSPHPTIYPSPSTPAWWGGSCHFCTRKTFSDPKYIFAAEKFEKDALKSPQLWNPLTNLTRFKIWIHHSTAHKLWKFRQNCARDMPLRDVYVPKFRKIYSFGDHDPPLIRYGQNLAWRSRTLNFTPNCATYRPCGAKKLKIAPTRVIWIGLHWRMPCGRPAGN